MLQDRWSKYPVRCILFLSFFLLWLCSPIRRMEDMDTSAGQSRPERLEGSLTRNATFDAHEGGPMDRSAALNRHRSTGGHYSGLFFARSLA
ncbi:hypothetical protein FB451DRAFT_164453 [Mycena latifolia]|nr:hypothetical protein FB451DRAFT_164453 [Mycena latifolia]